MSDEVKDLIDFDNEIKKNLFLDTIYLTRESYIKCEGFSKYIFLDKHIEIVDIPTEII